MSQIPEPQDLTEKVMELIWVNENPKHNTWKSLIWNDYPLSDWEAKEILIRLEKTATEILKLTSPTPF